MKTLKESILADIDTNIDKMDQDIETATWGPKLTAQDFYKMRYLRGNPSGIRWMCSGAITNIIDPVKFSSDAKSTNIGGFSFAAVKTYEGYHIKVGILYSTVESGDAYWYKGNANIYQIVEETSLAKVKKYILSFIEHLKTHPAAFKAFVNDVAELKGYKAASRIINRYGDEEDYNENERTFDKYLDIK